MLPRLLVMLILCGASAGCRSSAPERPKGTGARESVQKYFDALAQQDWDTAYAQLHGDTQKLMDRPAFERQGHAYFKRFGFQPAHVFIRSCDEQDDKATAHINLSETKGSTQNRYREAVVLKRAATGWGIVLPANF